MPSDSALRELYGKACANGYAAALLRPDAYCEDMCGWSGDCLKAEMLGYRWHEFVAPRDLTRLKRWIMSTSAKNPIVYSGLDAARTGKMYRIAISKVSSPNLRLVVGCEREAPPPKG